jgi:hypothetical protein
MDTIIKNAGTLSQVTIDWSPTGGMIWLTAVGTVMMVAFAVWMVGEERASREVAQQALYRKAERAGRLRDEVRSASETVQAS